MFARSEGGGKGTLQIPARRSEATRYFSLIEFWKNRHRRVTFAGQPHIYAGTTMNESELEEFYRRYAPDVHRFSMFLSGSRAWADDLTSETFVRIWGTSTEVRE